MSARQRARQYWRTYEAICRQIEGLDPEDPESGDAARELSAMAANARSKAQEAERYADRADD